MAQHHLALLWQYTQRLRRQRDRGAALVPAQVEVLQRREVGAQLWRENVFIARERASISPELLHALEGFRDGQRRQRRELFVAANVEPLQSLSAARKLFELLCKRTQTLSVKVVVKTMDRTI